MHIVTTHKVKTPAQLLTKADRHIRQHSEAAQAAQRQLKFGGTMAGIGGVLLIATTLAHLFGPGKMIKRIQLGKSSFHLLDGIALVAATGGLAGITAGTVIAVKAGKKRKRESGRAAVARRAFRKNLKKLKKTYRHHGTSTPGFTEMPPRLQKLVHNQTTKKLTRDHGKTKKTKANKKPTRAKKGGASVKTRTPAARKKGGRRKARA